MAIGSKKFFLKQSHQVIYGVVLILLIPAAMMFNVVWSVNSFRTAVDASVQRQALMVGEIFEGAIYEGVENLDILESKVEKIKNSGTEVKEFDVLVKEDDVFKIVASFDQDKIGKSVDDLNHVIGWYSDMPIATKAQAAIKNSSQQENFWELVMPLRNSNGQKEALLSLRFSVKIIDDLVADTLARSYIILALTVVIVILLLILNTRLFEHALLAKKLKEVDEMKDEFISIASHELRTPITTLKGFISMAMEGDYGNLNEQGQKGFKIMEASANRLGALVEDLLNVSRIEQNRLTISPSAINLPEVLDTIGAEFELRVQEKGLKFKLIKEGNLPKVWADEDKLRQVLVNLMGNAVKYTKQGEIEMIAKQSDPKFVTINLKDTGIGMDAKDRESLFQKFYRVKGEETKGIVGTGLGLWITKQLVEMMGGQIYVDSIKHVGSQFYFTVPIYNKNIHKEKAAEEDKAVSSPSIKK